MNRNTFDHILEECVGRLQAGESIHEILESYPRMAERLRPLLQAAAHGRDLPKPKARPEARNAGREKVLAAAESLKENESTTTIRTISWLSRYANRITDWLENLFSTKEKTDMKLVYRIAIYALVTVMISGFLTVNASAESLPGDPLYGVKRGWEQTRLALTFNQESEQELEDHFEAERLEEVSALVDERRLAEVEFEATVNTIDGDLWGIGGFAVLVDPNTEITGDPGVGSQVEVEGQTQEDGKILASEIQTLSADDMDDEVDDDDEVGEPTETDEVEETETDEVEETETPEPTEMEDDEGTETPEPTDDEMDDDEDDEDDMDSDEDESEKTDVYGKVDSIGEESLVIAGTTYLIREETDFEDEVDVGDYVRVSYYENENGDLILLDVDLENEATVTPAPTDDDGDESGDGSHDDHESGEHEDDDSDD